MKIRINDRVCILMAFDCHVIVVGITWWAESFSLFIGPLSVSIAFNYIEVGE